MVAYCLQGAVYMAIWFVDLKNFMCRLEDFWIGYKLFYYAYYSRSLQHEPEFQLSKLGLYTQSTLGHVVW